MTIFNVEITKKVTIVVVAEDEDSAYKMAKDNASCALGDTYEKPQIHVTGEVRSYKHLRDGWDIMCIPYGGDGDTRLRKYLEVIDKS